MLVDESVWYLGTSAVRRSVLLPIFIVTALLTATALLTFALAATGGDARVAAPESASTAVVLRFYDAANATLVTGDATPLRMVLALEFADHAERVGLPPSGEGLITYLLGMRTAYPGLRLVAEDVVADDDRVAARVRLDGYEEEAFVGLSLPRAARPWGTVDSFRVDGDRVVEHWGDGVGVVPERLAKVQLPVGVALASGSDSPVATVQVRRLHLRPLARAGIAVSADTILLIEEGRLGVTLADSVRVAPTLAYRADEVQRVVAGREESLGRGDVRLLLAGATANLSNDGETPAVVLVTALAVNAFRQVAPLSAPSALATPSAGEAGVIVEILTEGSAVITRPPGTLAMVVTVARVTLAPGTSLVAGEQSGLALVVVEGGGLVAGGVARGPGAAVVLSATEATDLRNAGGGLLTLLAISVSADDTQS